MEIATDTLIVADALQSRQIPERADVYERANFILRDNPTKHRVDNYFTGFFLFNTAMHREWPKFEDWRKKVLLFYQTWVTTIELIAINGNYQLGLQVEF